MKFFVEQLFFDVHKGESYNGYWIDADDIFSATPTVYDGKNCLYLIFKDNNRRSIHVYDLRSYKK